MCIIVNNVDDNDDGWFVGCSILKKFCVVIWVYVILKVLFCTVKLCLCEIHLSCVTKSYVWLFKLLSVMSVKATFI